MRTDDATARAVLEQYRVWAVVGASADPRRASNSVLRFLLDLGYDAIPVNPNESTVLGRPCYPTLREVPRAVEVVDLFRRSTFVAAHVDEAIEAGAKAVWTQLGVVDEDAAAKARAAGLTVVMNRCPAQDWPRFFGVPASRGA